jgi:hypothetical protein
MNLMKKYLSRIKSNNKGLGNKSYNIYSRILDDDLWIVATEKELQGLVDKGIAEVIYTQEEANRLVTNKVSKDGLKAIHKVKSSFPLSNVEDISKKS